MQDEINKPENTGGSWGLNDIVVEDMIKRIIPANVFDFGCGLGKYGRMCFRLLQNTNTTGIDGYEPTIKWLEQERIYNATICGTIQENVKILHGDLAIFGDCLEHLEKEEIYTVINNAVENFKYIILTVPLYDIPQDEMGGNILEKHKTEITDNFFDMYDIREKHIRSAKSHDREKYYKMALLIKGKI